MFLKCKEKNSLICTPYILNTQKNEINDDFSKLNKIRRNSLIIKQLILWIWNLSNIENIDEWFERYTSVKNNEDEINNIITNTNINMDYRFPDISNPEEAINYLNKYIPYIFKGGVIFMYEKFYNSIYQYLINYQISTRGIPKWQINLLLVFTMLK